MYFNIIVQNYIPKFLFQMVPCTVVYHQHQPVFGYMAHNTLDGATAIARHRRQPKQQQSKCQDPRCCQSKTESSRLAKQ